MITETEVRSRAKEILIRNCVADIDFLDFIVEAYLEGLSDDDCVETIESNELFETIVADTKEDEEDMPKPPPSSIMRSM